MIEALRGFPEEASGGGFLYGDRCVCLLVAADIVASLLALVATLSEGTDFFQASPSWPAWDSDGLSAAVSVIEYRISHFV